MVERIQRTVTETDRNAGLISISNDCTKAKLQAALDASIAMIVPDLPNYKENVQDMTQEDWFDLKAPTFYRILKNRSTVPRGLSKAQGLEEGAGWNKVLANLLAAAFHKWLKAHKEYM